MSPLPWKVCVLQWLAKTCRYPFHIQLLACQLVLAMVTMSFNTTGSTIRGGGRHLRWGDERHNHATWNVWGCASQEIFQNQMLWECFWEYFWTKTCYYRYSDKTSSQHCIVYIPAGFEAWGVNYIQVYQPRFFCPHSPRHYCCHLYLSRHLLILSLVANRCGLMKTDYKVFRQTGN